MLDNLIAFRVLYMLVTPFVETKAYKLGIVDEKGKLLKKMDDLHGEERDAYNMLVRLVFNLKRLLIKLPGGDSKLKNIAAAYFLVKENIDTDYDEFYLEEQLKSLVESNSLLVEETLSVMNFLKLFEDGEGGAPVNHTGAAVSTDEPVIKKRRIQKFKRMV